VLVGGGGVAEGNGVAVLPGSGPAAPGLGSVASGPRFTAKNAMPPSAAAARSTAINQTATLLLRRPTSRRSMSLTLSSAPKFRVLP
jgi:hypothetical protein